MQKTKKRGDKGRETGRTGRANIEGSTFPKSLHKDGCLYIDGVVDSGAHGHWKVELENGMEALTTARKLEKIRVGLLPGDKVAVEIPALSLNPLEKVRGRVVWRYRI